MDQCLSRHGTRRNTKKRQQTTHDTDEAKEKKERKISEKPNYNKHVLKKTPYCQVLICDTL